MSKNIIQGQQGKIQSGFTLIELSMALLFVAFIMLFLSTTFIAIIRTYNKGVWISQINQAARQINADIGDRARFAPAATVLANDSRMCVGGMSYLWNLTDSASGDLDIKNWFSQEGSTKPGNTDLRLVRIYDPNGSYCDGSSKMPGRADANVSSLLGSGVIIQQFNVKENTAQRLLNVKAVFSTGGENRPRQVDGNWQCGDTVSDGAFTAGANQYCAFIDLDLTVFGRNQEK